MPVLFFTRILKLKQEKIAQREQRQSERYAVGSGFPLRVSLLVGSTETRGTAANLSVTGLALELADGTPAIRGEKCICRLEVEQHRLDLPARIAHLQAGSGRTACGVALQFDDFATKMAYLQLLEAVAMGATLSPASAEKTVQDASWLRKEEYRGEGKTRLSVWRTVDAGAIDDYFVRGHAKSPQLEVYTQENLKDLHKSGYSVPALKPYSGEGEEVGRLYRWVIPNLSPLVPQDIRDFLARHLPPIEAASVSAGAPGTR
jgi:hypothetical protein